MMLQRRRAGCRSAPPPDRGCANGPEADCRCQLVRSIESASRNRRWPRPKRHACRGGPLGWPLAALCEPLGPTTCGRSGCHKILACQFHGVAGAFHSTRHSAVDAGRAAAPDQQKKMLADLDIMRDTIGSVLAFARDDTKHEPRSPIDLSALVEGICQNASDAGEPVTFSGPRGASISGRPTALRRVVSNPSTML
jgi:hypothetical protein